MDVLETDTESADVSRWEAAAVLLPVGVLTLAGAMLADNYVDPLLIWGGSDCTTVDGTTACFGYTPAGLILIMIVATVLVGAAISVLRGD